MNDLLAKVKKYSPSADVGIISKAYEYAARHHAKHKRLSGDPYITHPIAVARILVDLEQDVNTIAASLLHDLIEDASVTQDDIYREFGQEIAKLVEGVTKLSQISFVNREERQAENFRKMFVAMGEDYHVIVIKLADRLHNMQTLQYLSPEKQKEIALETREIFAPLAHRMGMWSLKWQLEDLSFLYLESEKYEKIKQKVSESRGERESYIQEFISEVKKLMEKMQVKAEINGRAKHFYSIHQKMTNQSLNFDEIFDLTAVRIIVDEIRDCYTVLGVVHDEWKPIPGRFRDFIAMPKSNGYQSLHTTVVGPLGRMVEIQIRTREMHRIAEYGVAAHWRYKEGDTDEVLDMKMAWLRQMLEWQSELKDAKDFMENLKIDLVVDEVFVFTPKGDVFNLVIGSTPIDFAYRVHTEVGHRCIGAKVNGRIVALDHTLNNGDIIEIITGKRSAPSRDWLIFVKTPGAKVKIKNWFKKCKEEEKEMLPVSAKEESEIKPLLTRKRKVPAKNAVKVSGLENVLVKFSKCCYPIPGEEIIGFVTKTKGIAIHRRNCQTLLHHLMPEEKRIKVEWNHAPNLTFPVEVEIEAFDRVGVLKDVLSQISETGTNVSGAKASSRRGSSAILKVTVDVRDVEHLNQVVAAIRKVSDVYDVLRK